MNIDELIGDKLKLTKQVRDLSLEQNRFLKQNMAEKAIIIDENKQKCLIELEKLDVKLKELAVDPKDIQGKLFDTVNEINDTFNKLLEIEKENEKLAESLTISNSGSHIEAYTKTKQGL